MLTGVSLLLYIIIFLLLAALAYTDVKEYILPDKLNAILAVTFLAFHTLHKFEFISLVNMLVGALAGGGFLLAIRQAAHHFYKKDSLGLGDVKLMAAAGIGLGFPGIMLALSLGAMAGLAHGAVMWLMQRKSGKKVNFSEINVPAGLGLTIGIAIVMLIQFKLGIK